MKLRGLLPNFHIHISLRDEGQAVLSHPVQYMYLEGLCRQHCKQDPFYVFPEMRLRGLLPNFHIHVSLDYEGQAVLSHPTVFKGLNVEQTANKIRFVYSQK